MNELLAALAGATLGGVLALVAAAWSFRSIRRQAETDAARRERDLLRGLIAEIGDCIGIAKEASATLLPVAYLHDAMPLRLNMDKPQREAVDAYANAVLRYNGRVNRLVSFGGGKRAAGESPGAEKISKHAPSLLSSGAEALARITELEREQSAALELRSGWRWAKSPSRSRSS